MEAARAMKNGQREVIVLYSGGLDSTATAALYAHRDYTKVHLLTFDNGTQSYLELSEISVRYLQEKFKKTEFKHKILSSAYLFKKVAFKPLEEDSKKYSTNLVCIGCKMAMHAEGIVYALDKGLTEVADGFVRRQEGYPEQHMNFIKEMRKLYERFRIKYVSPLYSKIESKEDVKDLLFKFDLPPKSIEPSCLLGGTFSAAKAEEITAYFKEKEPLLEEYIEQHLKEISGLVEWGE